jgi:hypothetical protein
MHSIARPRSRVALHESYAIALQVPDAVGFRACPSLSA